MPQAVDVADATGQEVDAQVGDGLALRGIGKLALGRDAVLGAADAADLGLDGETLLVGQLHELLGALDVGLELGLVRAVVHDGGEARVDALEAVLIGAVIEVQGDGDGNVHGLDRRDSVVAGLCGLEHGCSVDEHVYLHMT